MTITVNSPWRTLGKVSYDQWMNELWTVASPITDEGRDAWRAAGDHSALCLGMLREESQYATAFNRNSPGNFNPLNLRPPGGDGYLAFRSYTDGIRAWAERITDPTYKGGVYGRTQSIRDLIGVYAPGTDSNDPDAYAAGIATTVRRIIGAQEEQPPVTTPATIDYSRLPFPVRVNFVPVGQTNNRPGIPMTPTSGTWHETGNYKAGADAAMHERWLLNGAPGAADAQVCVHFFVDDHEAVQMLPLNEVAWHAGDGANGPGNTSSISVECCVNSDGELARAQDNCAALFGLLYAESIIMAVWQHNHWSGKDCPHLLRQDKTMTWSAALTLINRYDDTYNPPTHPVPDPIWWTPGVDVGPQKRASDGAVALAMLGEVTADRTVPIYRNAAMRKGDIIETWTHGTTGKIAGTYLRPNGLGKKPTRIAFVQTSDGGWGRARLSAFSPDWPTL